MNHDNCLDIRLKVESNKLIRTKVGFWMCRWGRLLKTLGEARLLHSLAPQKSASNIHMRFVVTHLWRYKQNKKQKMMPTILRTLTFMILRAAMRMLSALKKGNCSSSKPPKYDKERSIKHDTHRSIDPRDDNCMMMVPDIRDGFQRKNAFFHWKFTKKECLQKCWMRGEGHKYST